MKRLLPALFLVVAAVTVLVWRVPNGVETDLHGLADSRQGGVLREIAQGLAGQGRVLLEGEDFDALREEAIAIGTAFGQPPVGDFRASLKFIDEHKSGLLSSETRNLLLAGRFREVADGSVARLFGPVPPLFSVKRDPFLLGTDYVLSLQSNLAEDWTLRDGFPVCTRGDRTYLLLTLDLSRIDAERIVAFMKRCADRPADAPVKIWCGGPPFHSARASMRAKREINLLSGISLALVVLFGWLLFRSFGFIPHLLLAQTVGFLFATAALFAAFPRPHVLTFVFGTSLIGLSVDYVYHARAAGDVRRILRPLSLSLLTTVACFAPLLFSDVAVLRQMAVFTIAGLVATYGFVTIGKWRGQFQNLGSKLGGPTSVSAAVATERGEDGARTLAMCRGWPRRIFGIGVVVLLVMGFWRLRLVDDPAAFYRPEAELMEGERKLAELSPGQARRFAFVPGATVQEALEKEESAGVKGLSAVVPSLRRQRENAALVEKLVAVEGSNYTARTGLKMPKGEAAAYLDPEQLEEGPLKQMVRTMRVGSGLLSPLPEGTAVPAGVEILEPRAALAEMFGRFTSATVRLLAISLAVFALLLVCVFRRTCLRYAAPVFLSFAATAGTLGWLGVPVTFFTLLCFFVLAGLGIDYAIFHRGHPAPETRRTVFYSFLTSFAGLGMLAFTEFPVTRSMGITFALGLFFAYVFSRFGQSSSPVGRASMRPPRIPSVGERVPRARDVDEHRTWHEQGEQSAGRWRMQFMWWMYSWFGKGFLKIVCVPVMAFIYPFAKPAKKALRDFYKVLAGYRSARGMSAVPVRSGLAETLQCFRHLLGFAWSLADKTDACTLKRALPKMTVRDDAGAKAFRDLVAAGRGAFLISTHVGTIEVLPALASPQPLNSSPLQPLNSSTPQPLNSSTPQPLNIPSPHVHAFQQMGHDAVFTRMFMRHFDSEHLTLHAVEEIGVETAVAMQEAIGRGEFVLMAGDRVSAGSGRTLAHDFLGRPCRWPKGVFTFAKLMEAPVFFVTCVRTGWNAYECRFRKFGGTTSMLEQYVGFLEAETLDHPEQWYQFYDFFGTSRGECVPARIATSGSP